MFKNYDKKTIEESGKVLNVVAMIKDLDESQEEERGEGASNESYYTARREKRNLSNSSIGNAITITQRIRKGRGWS